jgi:predicted unusual protein kinase regulating ubiquinone biosynthesis (AarF/ABC1/UbiB family)
MKQVVSLLVGTTVNQIAAGLVHSDIHIGNFRVTPDKKVAILDRNFFLSPTPQEQELLFAILNPLEESSRREELLINYLNIPITTSTLKKSVAQVTEGMQEKDWSKAQSGLISLKQNGVKIPLTITLLIKNFNSLRLMAQKAGFKDLSETFAYST